MRTHMIFLAVGLCGLLAACGGAGRGESVPDIAIDVRTAPADMARIMADTLSPTVSAEMVVEWFADGGPDYVRYAGELTRELSAAYGTDGRAELFNTAVDSIVHTLPVAVQARIFVAVSTPGRLGRAVRADADSALLKPAIINAYGTDSACINEFLESLY
ncbi:MAG: hypothetical protein NC043_08860 [Muribaculaceae bacterium]|nr:hypothetical protein [Muribaculaceae bacterium]